MHVVLQGYFFYLVSKKFIFSWVTDPPLNNRREGSVVANTSMFYLTHVCYILFLRSVSSLPLLRDILQSHHDMNTFTANKWLQANPSFDNASNKRFDNSIVTAQLPHLRDN